MNVGHTVSKTTIANVLRQHGIKPAPDRHSSWRVFLKAHWDEFGATDFFTTEVWTPSGLRTYYVLFFMKLAMRRVHVAEITANPTDWFMGQATLGAKDFLKGLRFMIHDNDTKYSLRFRIVLEDLSVKPIRTPYQAPNANAWAERFVRSIKEECLNRVILFGEGHLRRCIEQYLEHYHRERNHQGLGNRLLESSDLRGDGKVVCSERLGGLLKFYSRAG